MRDEDHHHPLALTVAPPRLVVPPPLPLSPSITPPPPPSPPPHPHTNPPPSPLHLHAPSIVSTPACFAAASAAPCTVPIRPFHCPFANPQRKLCTPMHGTATAIRSSAAAARYVSIPPLEKPINPMRLGSTSARVCR